MTRSLTVKVAVVTGAAKGIGAGIAKAMAAAGASVVVNFAVDRSGAEGVVAEIETAVETGSLRGVVSQFTSQMWATTTPASADDANKLLSRVLRAHARTARLRSDQGASSEFVGVATENGQARGRLLGRAESNHAHDAGVRLPSDDSQFAKVLIERENHLTCALGVGQNCRVAGVRRPIADALDFVAGVSECRCH